MLSELSVQNLALIEDVRVELAPGFCAWTGETGAGKSLLLGALDLLLGGRGSSDLIRTGADELRVTGRFELVRPAWREGVERVLGLPLDDDQLILARRLSRAGRSYAYANDQPVALATLRSLGELLVDIHGQRESQSLLQPAYQLHLLDGFGKLDAARHHYAELADRVRTLRREQIDLTTKQQQRQRKLALLQFEREELDQAALSVGEGEQLARERERLAHAQSLLAFVASGVAVLAEDEGSVVERVGRLAREAQHWAALDAGIADAAQRLEALTPEVQDLAATLGNMAERFEADPNRLEEIEQRLQLLRRLEKKYGKSADELVAYHASLDERTSALQLDEEYAAKLDAHLVSAYEDLRTAAADLSKSRQKVAKRLAGEAQKSNSRN